MNTFVHRITRSVAALVLMGAAGSMAIGLQAVHANGHKASLPVVRPGTGDSGSLPCRP